MSIKSTSYMVNVLTFCLLERQIITIHHPHLPFITEKLTANRTFELIQVMITNIVLIIKHNIVVSGLSSARSLHRLL